MPIPISPFDGLHIRLDTVLKLMRSSPWRDLRCGMAETEDAYSLPSLHYFVIELASVRSSNSALCSLYSHSSEY